MMLYFILKDWKYIAKIKYYIKMHKIFKPYNFYYISHFKINNTV